ncbi:MAG: hypothetical protein QME59_05370 [Candidatus Hydrothermarchaeota archaeon]|nr:hypothetical protein [Candidatus Hydrothermarchaeota archaeon]
MAETVDELVAKHSRRELEKMAYELGVEDVTGLSKYPDKSTLAEALLKARKEREGVVEKVRGVFKPKAEKAELRIGKNGVFAKRVAIEVQAKENAEAVKKIDAGVKDIQSAIKTKAGEIDAGLKAINAGAKEIQKGIKAQAKENADAVAKIGTGVREIQSAMKEKAEKIRAGIEEMREGIQAQVKENENYVKDFYYG